MTFRKIVVEGHTWGFFVGKGTTVVRHPDGVKRFNVPNHSLIGVTPDTFERGKYKKTSDGMVTPRHIREYILKMKAKI